MANRVLLSEEIAAQLATTPGWELRDGAIRKTFTLKNFAAAIGFINAVSVCAETADHHPDIFLHGWNKVDVILSTHKPLGITEKDFAMAKSVDALGF